MAVKSKRKRDQKDTKAKLLKAALDVFSKDGYDAATTRKIAKKAGVNESLIHRYFASKLGLFFALKKEFRDNLVREILAYEECDNLADELVRFMSSRLQSTKRDKKFFKLSISRAILDPKAREDVRAYASMRPPELIERFEKFRRKGQIRAAVDLDRFISVLHTLAFAFSILTEAIECLPLSDAEDLIRSAADVMTGGLNPRP